MRRCRLTAAAMLAALTVSVSSCHRQEAAVPRPVAYPRIALPDTAMAAVDSLPVYYEANASATVSSPRRGWLDIAYPGLNATIHVTFTTVDATTIGEVIDNRLKRLSLNSGDNPGVAERRVTAAGFSVITVETQQTATPLQFLATDDSSIVVSGVVYLSDPRAVVSVDSMTPVVEALRRDVTRSLNTLSHHDN